MLRNLLLALTVPAMALIASPAVAQTPDGQTPAVETVCDPLRSATPGLYGLCVAYCESHDADLDPETLEPRDNSVANTKILENYNRRKSASDPEMPCLKPACPCFDAADLAGLTLSVCSESEVSIFARGTLCSPRFTDVVQVRATSGHLSCTLIDRNEATCELLVGVGFGITPDEYLACRDLLLANLAQRELTCL